MADKIEINFKPKVFFYDASLFIAIIFSKLGFVKTTLGVFSVDISKKKDISLWLFCYPIIR